MSGHDYGAVAYSWDRTRCVCGDWLVVTRAEHDTVARVLRAHYATANHRAWRGAREEEEPWLGGDASLSDGGEPSPIGPFGVRSELAISS